MELRRLCAGQLPAVLRAATALSATAFTSQFQDTLNNLATDSDMEVRRLRACVATPSQPAPLCSPQGWPGRGSNG